MANEFSATVLTPANQVLDTQVTEVILPAFDGECGILAGHEDFIGLLGTGVLKIVRGGDDYWYVVSSGVFEVSNGKLTVLAEHAEQAQEVDADKARAKLNELEPKLGQVNSYSEESEEFFRELERAKARLEVHRRTHLVN